MDDAIQFRFLQNVDLQIVLVYHTVTRVLHETSAILYVSSGQQPRASTVDERPLKIYSLTTCSHKEEIFFNHIRC